MASTSKRSKLKLVVLLLSPVAALLVLEIACRYRAHIVNRDTLGAAFSVQPEQSPDDRVRFRDIIQPSSNDRIIYELRPNLDTVYKGGALQTSSVGLRATEYPEAAEEGTITIVGIGASNMFGHGVSNQDLYTGHLERLLRARYPDHKWRVINTAVPSYNVVMKVETLKAKGLRYDPDFVILHVASNNLDLPNYVRVQEDPYDLGNSFLLDFVRDKRYELAAVEKSSLGWNMRSDPEKIPERFRGLVGWDPCHAALDELAALGEQHDFEVFTFAYLKISPNGRLINQATKRGMHAMLFVEDVIEHLESKYGGEGFSEERYLASDLVVSPANSHPSPRLHELTAEWVLREMETRGVIERLLEARQ